jgi:ribosomal protein S6E (S10)
MDRWCIKGVSTFIIAFGVIILTVAVCAAGVNNAGFKEDVPPALKERFSLCDDFLDVKWLDQSRSVGILKAEVYKNNMREPRFLIVYLEKPGSKAFAARGNCIFYEISEKQYSSMDFEQFLRGAHYTFSRQNVFMTVKKGKKSARFPQEPLPFEAFVTHETEFPNRSFSEFSKTVCVAYPDGKRAFVAEAKKPFMQSQLDDKSKQAYDTVAGYAKEKCGDPEKGTKVGCNMNYLKDGYALDINGDGKDDYFFVISDKQNGKGQSKRYLLLSSKDGYTITDISGCLGNGRFFYGYADSKSLRLGRCSR